MPQIRPDGTVASTWQDERDQMYKRAKGFDATQGLNNYARGAWGSISEALGHELNDLGGSAVGAGRFNSGFYDEDRGVLFNNATRQFSNAVAGQSVNAQGQQIDANRDAYSLAGDAYAQEQNDARDAAERKRRRRAGIGEAIGGILGAAGGSFFGPGGAAAGAKLGSGLGGAVSSW